MNMSAHEPYHFAHHGIHQFQHKKKHTHRHIHLYLLIPYICMRVCVILMQKRWDILEIGPVLRFAFDDEIWLLLMRLHHLFTTPRQLESSGFDFHSPYHHHLLPLLYSSPQNYQLGISLCYSPLYTYFHRLFLFFLNSMHL